MGCVQWQFETVAEHNHWTPCMKATHLITILNELAAHTLHGIPTGVTYEEVSEALEHCYGDHYLEAAFTLNFKGLGLSGNPCRSLPLPSTTWLTTATLNYQNI
jgi:hypothetical protein